MPTRRSQLGDELLALSASLLGSLLLSAPAWRYRIDRTTCATWPPPGENIAYGAMYLAALTLLALGWLGMVRAQGRGPDGENGDLGGGGASDAGGSSRGGGGRGGSDAGSSSGGSDAGSSSGGSIPGATATRGIGRVLLLGLPVHLVALLGPPFLSTDPLFYAAIGRALATFHHSTALPMNLALPPGDPFLTVMSPAWQHGTSPYFAGFSGVAWLVAQIGGGSLLLHLRLYQCVGLLSMLAAAGLTGLAAASWRGSAPAVANLRADAEPPAVGNLRAGAGPTAVANLRADAEPPAVGNLPGDAGPPAVANLPAGAGPRAAALFLFCPLAVIDGTQAAHNDGLLAVATAGFALFVVRRRPLLAILALLAAVTIKASALLLLGFYALHLLLRRVRPRLSRGRFLALSAAVLSALLIASLLAVRAVPALNVYAALLGSPAAAYDYCTRSIECLPRVILRFLLHAPTASWGVGLLFRLGSGLLCLHLAYRSAESNSPPASPAAVLTWAAAFVFFYYLYLHGWSQSWYLLTLLPLLAFVSQAHRRLLRAMVVFLLTSMAYYALVLPLNCVTDPLLYGLSDAAEAFVEIIPPTLCLLFWKE